MLSGLPREGVLGELVYVLSVGPCLFSPTLQQKVASLLLGFVCLLGSFPVAAVELTAGLCPRDAMPQVCVPGTPKIKTFLQQRHRQREPQQDFVGS